MDAQTAGFETVGTFTHPNLIAGDFPRVERKGTLLAGAGNLNYGAVLAEDSANNNKLVLVDDAHATVSIRDGYCILAHDADASANDVEVVYYLAGEFNEDELSFGGDDTIADHRAALRTKGIYTRKNLGA